MQTGGLDLDTRHNGTDKIMLLKTFALCFCSSYEFSFVILISLFSALKQFLGNIWR